MRLRGKYEIRGQELYASEIVFDNGKRKYFDASLEEILHLITDAGYGEIYPHVFSDDKDSQVAFAMKKARGGVVGHARPIYPKKAWFSYTDESCDHACQISEYLYFLITSYLTKPGMGQDFPGRRCQIVKEWRLNTHDKVVRRDKAGTRIIANRRYHLPTMLPNGRYPFTQQRNRVL